MESMNKNRLLFFIFLLSFSPFLFSLPYDMIPVGDPILEDLRYLSLETGRSFNSFTPPLSPDEVRQFLDSLDISLLSRQLIEVYDRVETRLNRKIPLNISNNLFTLSLGINSTIEARARFNKEIEWEPVTPKIPALLSLPLRISFAESFQLYFEPLLSADPEYYSDAGTFGINVPYQAEHFDINLPLRAFVALGGSWWNFQLGRDRVSYGNGQMGNLSISDNSAFYDFARLSVFTSFLKYSVLVSQMPLQLKSQFYVMNNSDNLSLTTQRFYYLHRVDVTLFKRINFSLSEGLIAGNSGLEIRYLNPMMIFHSLYSSWDYKSWGDQTPGDGDMNGSFLSLELNWNIVRSFAVYGQFAMNEFATKYELDINPDQPPNSIGYMAGIRYSHSFKSWNSIFYLEFIKTNPYLYMNSTPFASFIQMRRLSLRPGRVEYYYIGYPRDTLAMTLGTKFYKSRLLNIGGEFSWISRGEHGIVWDWETGSPANQEKTPSGIANNNLIAAIEAQWNPLSFMSVSGGVSLIFSLNNGHVSGTNETGGQAFLSVSFSY